MKKNLDPKRLTVAEQIVLAMIQIYWMQNEIVIWVLYQYTLLIVTNKICVATKTM